MHDLQQCKSIGCSMNWRSEELHDYCPTCRDKNAVPSFGHLRRIDSHRVNHLFQVNHPCLQEAVHYLLETGKQSGDGQEELVDFALRALNRFQEMVQEDKQGAAILAG